MGTQINKDYLRGFLIPYPISESEFWTAQATGFNFQSPVPDQPLPEANSKLYLNSNGECLTTTDLQVITRRSGISNQASYTVRDNTDSTTIEYGHNPPTGISDWDLIVLQDGSKKASNPDILGLPNNSYICVYEYTNITTSLKSIRAQITDSNRTVTDVTIVSAGSGAGFTSDGKPCICLLEDESLLLAYLYTESDAANLILYRSTNYGENWSFVGKQLFDTSIDVSSGNYTIQKMRIRHVGGQTLIIIGAYDNGTATNKNVCFQYASVDTCNFELVTATVDTQPLNRPDLTVYKNQFCIGYGTTTEIRYVVLPHAFYAVQDLISAAKFVTASTGAVNAYAAGTDANMTTGMIAIHSNSNDELIFVFSRLDTNYNDVQIRISKDGQNWPSHACAGGLQSGRLFHIDSD